MPPPSDSITDSGAHFVEFSATPADSMTIALFMRGFVPPESASFSAAATMMPCRLRRTMCGVTGNLYPLRACRSETAVVFMYITCFISQICRGHAARAGRRAGR